MNPNDEDKKETSMELPAPVDITSQPAEEHGEFPSTEEGHAKALELGMSQQPPQDLVASSDDSSSSDPAQGSSDGVVGDSQSASAPTVSMPQIADDNDLIEKEWVEKAKQIVDKTKDDPYNQNREMGKMRADYLKKRYNKEIKLVD